MSPRRTSAALAVSVFVQLSVSAVSEAQTAVDVLLRGGTLVDGTGAAAARADIGITGDRISFVGDAARTSIRATRTIDVSGLLVVPGFIDPHAHVLEDLSNARIDRRRNVPYLMQGVTTTITGNDGGGPADVGATLAKWDTDKIGTNAALLIGFGSVRRALLGSSDGAPTAQQLDSMRALVRRSMEGGALGLSTGLYYAPQSFAATPEVVAVTRTIASFGGVYDSHLRDESSYTIGLLGAVREAIAIGREAGVAVNISHIKALGVDVWGKADSVTALITEARSAGQRVTADQYPYLASGSSVGASLLPRWAEAGGGDSLQRRIADPTTRARLVTDMTENLRRRGGAASLLITGGAAELRGKTLEQLAQSKGVSPIEMALEIITGGGASVASFNMNEADIESFMRQPFVMTGSDGSAGHPRKYGTYPLVFRRYVFEKKVLTLEQAVKRSSSQVAEVFGIADRGIVRRGAFADVVVIDTAQYRDRSTYQEAQLLATGVRHVFVNGTLAVENGAATEAMAGRALRRSRGASSGATRPGVDGNR